MKEQTVKCCECGRFCLPYASAIPWGESTDLEPPDPVLFCMGCFQKWEANPKKDWYWAPPRETELAASLDEALEEYEGEE